MMQGLRILVLIAVALLPPLSAEAADADQYDALAPSVVREGDFALELAAALALPEAADDEQQAMAVLSARGIEPLQGWMPDYPMTPQIVADLHLDVANAALAGRLGVGMDVDTALRAFVNLVADLGLPLPTAPVPGYSADAAPVTGYAPICEQSAFDDYYGSYGPPIYTYCSPPVAYVTLYSWVPYGFHWHGHHYPGYYVLKQVRVFPHDRRREPSRGIGRDTDRLRHERDHDARAIPIRPAAPRGAPTPHTPRTFDAARPAPPTTPVIRHDTAPRVITRPAPQTGPDVRHDATPRVITLPATRPTEQRDRPGTHRVAPATPPASGTAPPTSRRRVLPAPAAGPTAPARVAPSGAPRFRAPAAPQDRGGTPHAAQPVQRGDGQGAPGSDSPSAPSR